MKICLVFVFGLLSFTASEPAELLIWDLNRPLSWDDFKKRTGPEELYKAFTYSGIQFEVKRQDSTVLIQVRPYFDPTQSWVHKDHLDDGLLAHEQIHFDLTALAAVEMDLRLEPYRVSLSEFIDLEYMEPVQEMYDSLFDALDQRQKLYDQQTVHGTDTLEQMKWQTEISMETIQLGLRHW